ncbi:hypothetical protein COLO4_33568 [Corchorus olitorius]|uniref:Uncharacterized protein n=1 Tax=Corchorus olitorius TaxID=93759 RepID=A0A1R3GSV3_9ROSI|nr:hypothetical protein COLO4_33568 [Corchorus olitorius]
MALVILRFETEDCRRHLAHEAEKIAQDNIRSRSLQAMEFGAEEK